MYEGKNIHFSPVDNKPLCSFSTKLCKQRRLNGYAFCVRHILEDLGAPFKPCAYVAKLSQQRCNNPLPKNDNTRQYCNFHLQVLGLATKTPSKAKAKDKSKDKVKETKVKEKEIKVKDMLDNRMTLEDRLKKRFNLHQRQNGPSDDDPDDPYAFPDPGSESITKTVQPPAQSPGYKGHSPVVSQPATPPSNHVSSKISPVVDSNSNSNSSSTTPQHAPNTNSIPIAKLYPELAEKLEKARVKPEVKLKQESKSSRSLNKSSRTMNRLQTKIAQNKIKDKLKKNQGQNNQVIQESPSPQTPPASALQSALAAEIKLPFSCSDNGIQLISPEQTMGLPPPPEYRPPPPHLALQQQLLGIASLTTSVPSPALVTTPPVSYPNAPAQLTSHHLAAQAQVTHPIAPPPQYHTQSVPHQIISSPIHHQVAAPHPQTSTSLHSPLLSCPPAQPQPHLTTPKTSCITKTTATHVPAKVSPTVKTSPPYPKLPPQLPGQYLPTGLPVLKNRLKRPHQLLSETEARLKFKRHSAVKLYGHHAQQKIYNSDFLPLGVASSDDESDSEDELPWQQVWYVPSPQDTIEEPDDGLFFSVRTTKLSLIRSRIRRQLTQLHRSQRCNRTAWSSQLHLLETLIHATKCNSHASACATKESTLTQSADDDVPVTGLTPRPCLYQEDEQDPKSTKCGATTLPYTNHCQKHIMYNVDQQMFDFCTAKFSDNTQCCVPVFDIKHELPLCPEHAAKADNYQKNPDPRPKKPRKKTKPSALTRPPKKGKKKKNQKRNVRPQKPMPPLESTGNTEMPSTPPDMEVEMDDATVPPNETPQPVVTAPAPEPTPAKAPAQAPAEEAVTAEQVPNNTQTTEVPQVNTAQNNGVVTEEITSSEIPTGLLPDTIDFNSATKFLDEHDLHDVLDKLPDDAFDIFTGELMTGKNGEFMTTKEETEALERALAEASREVNSLEKSALSLMSENNDEDELTKQIADSILNQNLGSPGNPLDGDIGEDLGSDNLQDLANISTADLKTISGGAIPPVLASGVSNVPNIAAQPMQPHQPAILTIQGQGHLLGHGQQLLSHGQSQGPISVIQAQLAQGPLTQGQFQIQMPGALAALGGTAFTINSQGALIPSSTRPVMSQAQYPAGQGGAITPNCNGSNILPQFNNLLGGMAGTGINSTQVVTALPSTPLSAPVTSSQAIWTHAQPTQGHQTVTFQGQPGQLQTGGQGHFPVMQATLTSQGLAPGGVKVAYPLQALLPNATDLASMISTQSLEQALNINLGSQSLPLNQQPVTAVQKQQPPNT